MGNPRCPYCNVSGLDAVVTKNLNSRATLVYCLNCGAVHGIVPLVYDEPDPVASFGGQPAKIDLSPFREQPVITPAEITTPSWAPFGGQPTASANQQVNINIEQPTQPDSRGVELMKAYLLQIAIISLIAGGLTAFYPRPGQPPLPGGVFGAVFLALLFGITGGLYALAVVSVVGGLFGIGGGMKETMGMAAKGACIWAIIMAMACTPIMYLVPSPLSIPNILSLGLFSGLMIGVPLGAVVGGFSRLVGR
jgi:hypothetical protein